MISDYPSKYKQCLKKDPLADLDLVHDVILEFDAHLPKGVKSIDAIIPRRVLNREIDQWRARQRFIADSDAAIQSQESRELDPHQQLVFRESQELVSSLIPLLKPNHQEVLRLVFFEGLQHEQIAKLRCCTPQSVQTMLERAKAALKQLINQCPARGA